MAGSAVTVVLVLNARFLDGGPDSVPYGAVGFVRAVAPALRAHGYDVCALMYRRVPGLLRPELAFSRALAGPAAEVRLDFAASAEVVQSAVASCVARLARGAASVVLYHQTGVSLPFTPPGLPCLVTHHAPFVHDVVARLGRSLAKEAFEDRDGKLEALELLQRRGLKWLESNRRAIAIELSEFQRRRVLATGLPAWQAVHLGPPLELAPTRLVTLSASNSAWLERADDRLLVFAAAARPDGFKNLEAVAEAVQMLHEAGSRPAVYIAVGSESDHAARDRLRNRLPSTMGPWTWIEERLPPGRLRALFHAAAGRAVFAFPSRYETLGLTPLQAMRAGVVVAMPNDADAIGAVEYTPAEFRYSRRDGLAQKIRELRAMDSGPILARWAESARALTGPEFVARLERVVRRVVSDAPGAATIAGESE